MNSSPPKRASTASSPTAAPQALRHRRQQRVADAVPEAVVDGLEVVEVDEQQGHVPGRRAVEERVDAGDQLGAVGQAGEVVVGRRPLQPLGGPPLLGDVLDVGDGERHALVLGDGDPGAGPHELAVAAQVALVEQVGVGDAELEPGAVGGGGPQVVGVGDLADRCARRGRRPGRSSMSASERLASMIVESSSRTSAMPVGAEWNACWNRRRACSSARTRSSRSVTSRRRTTTAPSAWRGRSTLASTSVGVARWRAPAAARSAGTRVAAPTGGQPLGELVAVARRARRAACRRACCAAGQLGGLGVGAADDAVVVDGDDAFRAGRRAAAAARPRCRSAGRSCG